MKQQKHDIQILQKMAPKTNFKVSTETAEIEIGVRQTHTERDTQRVKTT